VPGAHHYIHLSQQPTVVNAIPEVVQARHRPFRREIGNDQSRSVYGRLQSAIHYSVWNTRHFSERAAPAVIGHQSAPERKRAS
jgi:hypothetical protein